MSTYEIENGQFDHGTEIKPEVNQPSSYLAVSEPQQISLEWYPYPTLIGSNVINEVLSSPKDLILNLIGESSI